MVFVTVGSQKFPFDRLLRAVDECVGSGAIPGEIFAQTGTSLYEPRYYAWKPFLDHDEFAEKMAAADIVIAHGGTGAIVGALKQGKKVIAMARLARFDEHVDDHQEQVLRAFERAGYLLTCSDAQSLASVYAETLKRDQPPYRSTNAEFITNLDAYLSGKV